MIRFLDSPGRAPLFVELGLVLLLAWIVVDSFLPGGKITAIADAGISWPCR